MSQIPFVDLHAQYLSIKNEIDAAIENVIKSSNYIGGEPVKLFEKEFADYLGIQNVEACANGTDSIEIILKALGIGSGDEVIVPAISWISTSEAVSSVGASPVFVDVDENTFTINANLIESKITSRTKAIIPVHLYGQPAEMDKIMSLSKKHKLFVIEDCAQAHGAKFNNQMVGTFGIASSFSFYPGKNLGAYGDAGAIATNDKNLAEKCRLIANHGQLTKHHHVIEGRNSRMDGLQAAILSVKLKHLHKWTVARQRAAALYKKIISAKSNILIQQSFPNSEHVYHLFVVRVKNRTEITKRFDEQGIAWAIHYPKALPFLGAYQHLNFSSSDFPVAAQITGEILSIPMYPELSEVQIEKIGALLF